LLHEYIVLDFLEGVKHNIHMKAKKLPEDIRAYFAKMGSQGGKLGGKIRAAKLNPARRREIATRAAAARWAKREESL
jgi:hypothetical protein